MVPLRKRPAHCPRDVLVLGAGPIGLAIAIELAHARRDVLVLDRRPPPDRDPGLRRQLLVARAPDLFHLAELGLDLADLSLVIPLAERRRADATRGYATFEAITDAERDPRPVPDLHQQIAAPPVALVPIGRLQQALVAIARDRGVEVRFDAHAVRLTRHARTSSLRLADGQAVHGALTILATGAARALVAPAIERTESTACALFVALLDAPADQARWVRFEAPDLGGALRCTALITDRHADAGAAIIVQPAPSASSTVRRQLAIAADACGLPCGELRGPPQRFVSTVSSLERRVIAGDGRAPVVVAGDAAQTGHVFTGLNAFVNLALARELCDAIDSAPLAEALAHYEQRSRLGAALLAEASRPHTEARRTGTWALPAP